MIRLFVSSVSVDLEASRKQIISNLQKADFDIRVMERFGAQPQAPIDVCLRDLRRVAGKSDRIDAEAAARSMLAGQATATPKTGVGALIQRGGRAVAGMLTIATAGGS